MLRSEVLSLVGGIALAGIWACGADVNPVPSGSITLQLDRLESGNLEYCNASGTCRELPYDGACETVEVDIDEATGGTCERCRTDDGTVVDRGCEDTLVACVLVTLPEPDCVICAYVDGAIIFSSCVAEESQEGCFSDGDCRPGQRCQLECTNDGCRPDERNCRSSCEGECVDVEEDPCLNFECREGQHCELVEPPCMSALPCPLQPMCVPDQEDLCANVECHAGEHCEVMEPECASPMGCPPYAACVANEISCETDDDCPSDFECLLLECIDVECEPGDSMCLALCHGICVRTQQDGCDNVLCADGEHCEMFETPCHDADANCSPVPVCLANPMECRTSDDCPQGFWCDVPQWFRCSPEDGRCGLPNPVGTCVPYDPCAGFECRQGEHCEAVPSPCMNMEGCPDIPVCVPDEETCENNADCPEGLVCEITFCSLGPCYYDEETGEVSCPPCYGSCVPTEPSSEGIRTGCSGQLCADEPINSTCEYRPEYACYDESTCERQADGACGWTPSDELRACLARY